MTETPRQVPMTPADEAAARREAERRDAGRGYDPEVLYGPALTALAKVLHDAQCDGDDDGLHGYRGEPSQVQEDWEFWVSDAATAMQTIAPPIKTAALAEQNTIRSLLPQADTGAEADLRVDFARQEYEMAWICVTILRRLGNFAHVPAEDHEGRWVCTCGAGGRETGQEYYTEHLADALAELLGVSNLDGPRTHE